MDLTHGSAQLACADAVPKPPHTNTFFMALGLHLKPPGRQETVGIEPSTSSEGLCLWVLLLLLAYTIRGKWTAFIQCSKHNIAQHSPIHPHIHTPTAESTMQGDSQLVGAVRVRCLAQCLAQRLAQLDT